MDNRVVYEGFGAKLYLEGKNAFLDYKGSTYHFGLQPFEPTTVISKAPESICDSDNQLCVIHNGFDVDRECKQLIKNGLTGKTITGNVYNAEHFCLLLIVAIEEFADCSISELEDEFEDRISFDNRTTFYAAAGVEFGRYGDIPDDDPEYAGLADDDAILPSDQELYIVVDGAEYALAQEAQKLHLLKRHRGKKKDHVHIHQMPDVINDHIEEMGKNEEFPLGERCYDNEMLCKILAYAVRAGKRNYNFGEIGKVVFDEVPHSSLIRP